MFDKEFIIKSVVMIAIIIGMIIYGYIFYITPINTDCCIAAANVTQFIVADYIPPLYFKWINISFVYDYKNNTYNRNIYVDRAIDREIRYYTEIYAPVGRVIQAVFHDYNPMISNEGGCPSKVDIVQSTMMWIGSFIVLIIYIIWVIVVYGEEMKILLKRIRGISMNEFEKI